MASCGISNIQLANIWDLSLLDLLMINLVTVYLKYIQFISTISEILPVSFIYDWKNMHHKKFISLVVKTAIQMGGNFICNSNMS